MKYYYSDELTPREKQVEDLLVDEGLSNKQIAERLIVSEHTAKAHVCSILMKRCFSNRIELLVNKIKNLKNQIAELEQKLNVKNDGIVKRYDNLLNVINNYASENERN